MPDNFRVNAMLQQKAYQDRRGVGVRLQRRSHLAGRVQEEFTERDAVRIKSRRRQILMAFVFKFNRAI
jgi:hypothetical protein